MSANDAIVEVRMSKDNACIVERACEFYARVLCGQFSEISDAVFHNELKRIRQESGEEAMHSAFNELVERRDNADESLKKVRAELFPDLAPCAHHGYMHSENTDRAFSMYQAIRYALAWHEHPEGGISVQFDKPMSPYDIPDVSVVESGQNKSNKKFT